MGLDTSHNCWQGSYGSFMLWRQMLASLIGIDLLSMKGFGGTGSWSPYKKDPLYVLLYHSDCDGDIKHRHLKPIAKRLSTIIGDLSADEPKTVERRGRYMAREDFIERTQQFIDGLLAAHAANENVEFH